MSKTKDTRYLVLHCGGFRFSHHTCIWWTLDQDQPPSYLWCHKSLRPRLLKSDFQQAQRTCTRGSMNLIKLVHMHHSCATFKMTPSTTCCSGGCDRVLQTQMFCQLSSLTICLRQHHQASVQHHQVHVGALPDDSGQLHQVDERHVQGVHRHLHRAAYRALHANQRGQEGAWSSTLKVTSF